MKFYTSDGVLALLCKMAGCKVEGKDIFVKLVNGERKKIRTIEVQTRKKKIIKALK